MRRPNGAAIACTLILAHIAWGLVRVPSRVIIRRLDDVDAYREEGAAAYLLGANGLAGKEAIEWLLNNTPADSVVLWSGENMGALEFAPDLIAPRLLVRASKPAAGQTHYAGLPIAQYTWQGRSGAATLVGRDDALFLEVR
ncbi:MAG: hypothetical protein ACI89X_000837 [Planctomycetota bacterium]|jgi:hypothetical protein